MFTVILITAMAFCVLGASIYIGGNLYVAHSSDRYVLTEEEAANIDADCILVLGCKVNGSAPSDMLLHRLMTGLDLYRSGAGKKLLMSGDHGTAGYDEVYVMKKYALDSGVSGDDVFCDHAGFSTYESLYRAKEIFGCKKVVVVTQKFHIDRAIYIGRSLGLEVYGVESDKDIYQGAVKLSIRESLARIKDIGSCMFDVQPTYLGEKIDISGSGSVTDDKEF